MAKTPEEQFGVALPEEPTLEAQASPPKPQENEPAPERPEWLPEKFKEPEQLVKSYSELESKLGSQGQTISDLEKQVQELSAAQQQEQQYQWQPQNDEEYLAQLYEENPVAATQLMLDNKLAEMQRQTYAANQQYQSVQAPYVQAQQATQAELIADVTARHMEGKYEDWSEFQTRAQEILQDRPIAPQDLYNLPVFEQHVEEAYKLAKYEALTGQESELRSAGVSQEEINRLRKAQAETLTARRSAPREALPPEQAKAQELIAARQSSGRPAWYG